MANTTGNRSRPKPGRFARDDDRTNQKDAIMTLFRTRPAARTLVAPFAAALLVSVALSGCTLRVTDPQDNNQQHVNTGNNQHANVNNNDDDDLADEDVADDDTDDTADGGSSDIDCDALEPDDVLYIDSDYDYEVVTVSGDCGDVSISASYATIYLNENNDIDVSGDGNTVTTEGMLSLTISGDDNTVTWDNGSPDVEDIGSNNTAYLL